MPKPGDIASWVAIIVSTVAIASQLVNVIKNRLKERDEIEQALDKAPLVREQLQLGNVGAAVEHLNGIIVSQSQYIRDQDMRQQEDRRRLDAQAAKIEQQVERIDHLEQQNEALGAESSGREREILQLQERIAELERQLAEGGKS